MKKFYETLENKKIDIKVLSEQDYEFLKKVKKYYYKRPDWNVFSNYWLKEGQKIWGGIKKREVVNLPAFLICQDLEVRLGIKQGKTRLPDYRDELVALIDKEFDSRYQFCRKTGIAQDTLSRILNKRREPSLHMLRIILDAVEYEISFQKKQYENSDFD